MAATYHFNLSRAILVGFRRQLSLLEAGQEMAVVPWYHLGYDSKSFEVEIIGAPIYQDDLTGQPLDPQFCRAARQKELDFFEAF